MALKRKYERVSDTVQRRNKPFVTFVTPAEHKAYAAAVQAKRDAFTRQVRVPAVRPLGEKKGMDTSMSTGAIPQTVNDNSGIYVLNLIQQGAGSWNRVGRKVNLRSIRIRGDIIHTQSTQSASGLTAGQVIRCVVVWDKQPSGGAIPQWQDMFGLTAQDELKVPPCMLPSDMTTWIDSASSEMLLMTPNLEPKLKILLTS